MTMSKTVLKFSGRTALFVMVLACFLVQTEFGLPSPDVAAFRFGIIGLGLLLVALQLSQRRSGYLAGLGMCYAMILGLSVALSEGGRPDVLMSVQLDLGGDEVLYSSSYVSRDQLDQQFTFETLMALRDQPYETQDTQMAGFAVQTVGRSQFSPMDLGGLFADESLD